MPRITAFCLTLLSILAIVPTASAKCLDISDGRTLSLEGRLTHRVFPGPPNYQDVAKGDASEPGYILQLAQPVCVSGDDFIDAGQAIRSVHLIPSERTASLMQSLVGANVGVELADPFGAHTAHHRAPLLGTVRRILQIGGASQKADAGMVAVTRFYEALSRGDGAAAAASVIPEKRKNGPLSAAALSAFYGKLKQPLQLLGVEPGEPARYRARYSFATGSATCNGRADVTTEMRGGVHLIAAIRALDGC